MTVARFSARPESTLLVAALKKGLGLPCSLLPGNHPTFGEARKLGLNSGLMPWVLEVLASSSQEAANAKLTYARIARCVLNAQMSNSALIASALRAHGINCPLFKGVAYAMSGYGCEAILNDIDMLVPGDSVQLSKAVLKELGFSQNIVSHDGSIQLVSDEAIATFESTHYELFPFTKIIRTPELDSQCDEIRDLGLTHPLIVEDESVYVAVEADVHHNLSHGIDAKAVLACTSPCSEEYAEISRLDWETHVWFVAARVYHETMVLGAKKLRPLVDLGRVLATKTVDWERVLDISEAYALSPSLYYPLCWLAEQIEGVIADEVLEKLDRDRAIQGLHDFGDFLPKILGEKVLLRPE